MTGLELELCSFISGVGGGVGCAVAVGVVEDFAAAADTMTEAGDCVSADGIGGICVGGRGAEPGPER